MSDCLRERLFPVHDQTASCVRCFPTNTITAEEKQAINETEEELRQKWTHQIVVMTPEDFLDQAR